jgi:hypothetical protein
MKPIIVKSLNLAKLDKLRRDLPALPGERPKDVAPPVRAGSRELVFTALVSKEGFDLSIKGEGDLEQWGEAHFRRSLHSLCEILRLQGDERSLTVTLKIEPVDRAAQIDAP